MLFKTLRKRTGLNQGQFGKIIGVTASAVSEYETGKSMPSPEKLPLIAKELGISVDVLLAGDIGQIEEGVRTIGNIGSVQPAIAEFYVQVPFLSARAQAGIPDVIYDGCDTTWIEETYPVFMPLTTTTKKNLIIEVVGDSMEPSILSGALVFADRISKSNIKYESGAVYAVLYGPGKFVVKRIKTNEINTNKTLTLWSDNDRYGHITLAAEDIHCMWKVIKKVDEVVR